MRSVKLITAFLLASVAVQAQYVQPMGYTHYSFPNYVNIGVGLPARVTTSSAYLEIGPTSGANRGLLPPRMSTTIMNLIASPANGLFIYNTDSLKYMYYNGSAWAVIGTGSGGGSTDTTYLSNRINLKLNIADTVGKWVGNIWISGGNLYMRVNGTSTNLGAVGGGSTDTTSLSNRIDQKISSSVIGPKSAVLKDGNDYSGFPTVASTPKNDTTWAVIHHSDDHASHGWVSLQYSINGGGDWLGTDTIKVNNANLDSIGTISLGYSNNKLFIAYNITFGATRFAYNPGRNPEGFIALDSVVATSSQQNVQSFNDGFTVVSDSIYFCGYSWNTSTDTAQTFVYKSSAVTPAFSVAYTVMKSKMANTFPEGPISEMAVRPVVKGTFDGTSTLIAFIRSDFYKDKHYQLYSTNGGSTWTKITSDWAFVNLNPGAANAYPVKLIDRGDYLYALVCVRETTVGNMSSRLFKMRKTDYATPNAWISTNGQKYSTVYRALAGYKSEVIDNGYGSLFLTPQQELRQILYDASPRKRRGVDGSTLVDRIRTVVTPVENVYYFEANAITNQAIPTGVRTALNFGNIVYDTDFFYNADSSTIDFPADGDYHVEVLFRVDTTSSGTEIIGELFRVDRGAELGSDVTAYNSALATLDYKAIQPSNNPKFTYIKLSGNCYGYKGMKVRVTLTHDKGSDLNIINSVTGSIYVSDGNASITIKKL